MRKFEVGDKVRFAVDDHGYPVWNHDERYEDQTGIASGVVIRADEWEGGSVFLVVSLRRHDKTVLWQWPQPGEPDARYGEPGYLELMNNGRL
jgi:ribosomal protein L21E